MKEEHLPMDEEHARRRRAVFVGLSPFLDEERVVAALWLWEKEFAMGPALALHGFVSRICEQAGLLARRQEVYRSLIHAMTRDAEELDQDPAQTMEAFRQRSMVQGFEKASYSPAAAEASSVAEARVFTVVMESFLGSANEARPGAVLQVSHYIVAKLADLQLPQEAFDQLRDWLMRHRAQLDISMSIRDRRAVLHLAYVAACEYLGPVAADQLLSRAIKAAEALPEGRRFPPRQLL